MKIKIETPNKISELLKLYYMYKEDPEMSEKAHVIKEALDILKPGWEKDTEDAVFGIND